ncbi:caprin homolog isoform X2 [Cotesia glomerata]|uniref:caprin homolog isoform X2 n=1 Tax=Cotesia glomerata TaxID=32391 RepID=UPI001D007605|nr:caprin homolog isoform X2 [Cotesia glomerata]
MPSANPKLEKQASTEATDPIRQAITVIEHKIRNLEKRKGKLEVLKDLQKNGKELNLDQKTTVAKYDEVLQTLEITRELYKQIVGISNDFAKQQKKQARKEALERMQQDISKIREVLLIQDVLINIGGEVVREDFLTGTNGAIKLTQDDLKFLGDFYNEVTMKRQPEPSEPSFMEQLQKAAEHYMGILEGKQREVAGTTYLRLKEMITSVQACGYFDQVQTVKTEVITNEVESELDPPEVAAGQPPTIVQHIPPPPVNAPIPTQTFTNQNFTGAPVQVPQQVIYQHPPQEMSHIPGFANPNPPPPIPMPPSHQQNIPYSPQHPAGQFQPPAPGQQAIQPTQNFDQQETQQTEEKPEQHAEETEVAPVEADPSSEPVNWCQMADAPMDEWSNDNAQQSEHSDHQQSQQGWGEQRSSYRGRGGRRGNSNGYNSRGRGTGNYQQNGRGGGGQGSYYRNDNSNYQNGYQQRNYNNDGGSSNYNGGGFKRERGGVSGGNGGPRTNSRGGDRVGIDRGGRGGQFRGGQRGGNRGGGYAPRGKPQTQQ